MQQTKFFFSLILGALLIAGLFLFFRSNKSDNDFAEIKPSQLNFNTGNLLPAPQSKEPQPTTQNTINSKELAQIEKLNAEEKSQWSVFENILKTKNDNDPSMDRELKKLSPALREALYQKYEMLPTEDHNGRGLIVYLVARELSSMEDIQFMKKVYQEPPCLSMSDCKSAENNANPHHSSMDQTTLVYQQLSGLYLIDKQLSENPQLLNNPASRSGFIQILAQAESFPIPSVHEKAKAIRIKHGL